MNSTIYIEAGMIPEDVDQYERMREAYFACEAAGIPIPAEIDFFFNGEEPVAGDPMEWQQISTNDFMRVSNFTGTSPHECVKVYRSVVDDDDSLDCKGPDERHTYVIDLELVPDNWRYIRIVRASS